MFCVTGGGRGYEDVCVAALGILVALIRPATDMKILSVAILQATAEDMKIFKCVAV